MKLDRKSLSEKGAEAVVEERASALAEGAVMAVPVISRC
jgi:hypothetical protein